MTISKQDWQLYKTFLGVWQERYISKLLNEYETLIRDQSMWPSQRFWALEERIREDKKNTCVICRLSKDAAVSQIKTFLANGTISEDDLKDFSDELVGELLNNMIREDR